jgi:hypothetical protein
MDVRGQCERRGHQRKRQNPRDRQPSTVAHDSR